MLTRAPLAMIDAGPNAQANDTVVFNGTEVEAQTPGGNNSQDLYITQGEFDPLTGVLQLARSDGSILQIDGFMTPGNIGAGPRGPTGPQGLPGVGGRNGKDGANGLPGCTGPKGDQGAIGGQGPTGPTGLRGPTGPQGIIGPTGATGPAGMDGSTPVYSSNATAGSEKLLGSRVMQWGRFTDVTAGSVKTLLLPSALTESPAAHAVGFIMQFINPASNVANKVRVDNIEGGTVTLSVMTSMLALLPDGNGGTTTAPTTGWDFYWYLVQ